MIQHGIDRAACFFSDGDRQVYLATLAGLARSCGVAIHAYVLMTNHVHLSVAEYPYGGLPLLVSGRVYALLAAWRPRSCFSSGSSAERTPLP
ncbi:MAG: hypothetical protein U1F76_29795 [Candidatus Competibacteraceae bacterium]